MSFGFSFGDGFPSELLAPNTQGGCGQVVSVFRNVRTVTAGKSSIVLTTISTTLNARMEAKPPKRVETPQGKLDKTAYVMTWVTPGVVQNGDFIQDSILNKRHVAHDVRYDFQGQYFTCRLETEAE